MSFSEEYLGTRGRMGRLAFLGWSCGVAVVTALIVLLALYLIALGGFSTQLGWTLLGLAVLLFLLSFGMAFGRRLHDLGLSAGHAAWLVPLLLVGGWLSQFGPGGNNGRLVAGVVALVPNLCLAMAPGQRGPNAYGPAPR